jgi:hypothetical protein
MATTSSNSSSPKQPAYIAYHVQSRDDKPSFWTRIGGVFEHSDGKGYSLQLSVLPIDGRIVLRLPADKKN